MKTTHRIIQGAALAVAGLLVCGCGGGGGGPGPVPDPRSVNVAFGGVAGVKVRSAGNTWIAMTERLQRLENRPRPDRRLLVSTNGDDVMARYEAPAGWSLVDFALHPSGQATLVLASETLLRLVRLDAAGSVQREQDFADPAVASDPFYGAGGANDPQSMVPNGSRDAARLAAVGEDAILAIRTGRNAVVAYRLRYDNIAGGFNRTWRTLVEPGVPIGNRAISSGTFDPFFGLDNQWRLVMDADAAGRVAIGVNLALTGLAAGHAEHFGEALDPELFQGFLVSALDAQGQRVSTALFDVERRSEIHAIRWAGEDIVIGGREYSESRPDGTGWNAFAGIARPGSRVPASYQRVDVERGDVILDLLPLSDGTILAAGSTGYTQNPSGGSISEEAKPMLVVLEPTGQLRRRVAVAGGARNNQLRGVAAYRGSYLTAGWANGPGTHSADADPTRLFADGYVLQMGLAP